MENNEMKPAVQPEENLEISQNIQEDHPGAEEKIQEPVQNQTDTATAPEDISDDEHEDPMETEEDHEEVFEHPDYQQELTEIIRSDITQAELRERLADYHANDLADALKDLSKEERISLYHVLGAEEVSEIFAYLDDASDYIAELTPDIAADIVQNMDADDAVDVLEDLDEAQQRAIIQHMDDDEAREDIQLIQSYEDDEIGSKMTTNYIAIPRFLTVKQAMKSLVDQAADNDNLSTIYVLEDLETEKYYGAINLQDLIIARDGTDLDTLVTTSYPYVYDHESVDDCIEQLKD